MQSSATLLLRRVASRPLCTLAPRIRIAAQSRPFSALHGGLGRSLCAPVTASWRRASSSASPQHEKPTAEEPAKPTVRENIYTIPNLLTLSRIAACPVLAYSIIHGDFATATAILAYAGTTDWVDGYVARRWPSQRSVLGTILDPAADKTLVTTLTLTLAYSELLPLPLAVVIIGRDVLLSISAFYYRYISLPPPKTFTRYWDFGIPSAEVRPTQISKVNTALQLLLMGLTTINPVLPIELGVALTGLQWTVGTTTIWSGLSYVFSKDAVKILAKKDQGADRDGRE